MSYQALFYTLPREKTSNDRVDMYTRLKGPEVEDGCLKIVQDWNS